MIQTTCRALFTCLALSTLAGGCARAATPVPPESPLLPLRSVRLYETGVAYFERSGTLTVGDGTTLPVPAAHIDDALKSLVIIGGEAGATVDGLEFSSLVTSGMARALAGLPKDADSPIEYVALLSSLEGEEVAVVARGSTTVGRVVDVVERPRAATESAGDAEDGETAPPDPPEYELLLVTKSSTIHRFPLDAVDTVKPLTAVAASRLALAVSSMAPRAAQARRLLRVMAASRGPVTLGYVAETPLWRTTYRIVLGDDREHGTVSGWVLLHNDTDEDWRRVAVELVNGRPDSFLFPLAAPRYGRRELVTPEAPLSTVPQLLDQTPDAMWGDHADLEYEAGYGGGTGQGYGAGYGRLGGSHRSRAPRVRTGHTTLDARDVSSELLEVGDLAGVDQATGVEAGALFVYQLPRPLDLRAHGSALVPFVQREVTARRITIIDEDPQRPRMGILFRNDTGQTLPGGPLAVFSAGGFAGESALNRLKPGERRWLSYGADIDVEASAVTRESSDETKYVLFVSGRLEEHFLRREHRVYSIENRGGQDRTVHWRVDVVNNTRIEGADAVEFDRPSASQRVVFEVPKRQRFKREVTIEQGLSRAYSVQNIDEELVQRLLAAPALPEEQRSVLRDAQTRVQSLSAARKATQQVSKAIETIAGDLDRLREHLKALGDGDGGAARPLVQRVLQTEDRLDVERQKLAPLEEAETARLEALREVLASLDGAAPEPKE